ncbi:hypothetical protein L0B52_07950 [Suttonella sp. R2A3]|uniref:hypothetical protein n=1 Tax=Suttonella sp. R2A3 TaxID=2908648 RepID=UPI001F22D1B8|nr:hypothetical protein [Suttonella sp. R2A3]UJF24261.1 hypothetical protein L0B52_07950 [Suttonella sp. R2A3]
MKKTTSAFLIGSAVTIALVVGIGFFTGGYHRLHNHQYGYATDANWQASHQQTKNCWRGSHERGGHGQGRNNSMKWHQNAPQNTVIEEPVIENPPETPLNQETSS